MINRLLVANRAEIASRVFRTCRRLGIETVAVHADADAGLPFVAEADLAVRLAGSAPADTYLRADVLVEAAVRAGADAIHPGYGFLSENADFARAVLDAGLVWVGPTPESIELMGSKLEAKRIMAAAGVPVLTAPDEPAAADLPLIVKASAGGGGRGMRIVRSLADLPGAVEAAGAEALSAFGDATVFVEPYVEHGRHVEVQVVGHAGGVLVLGERDCSLQRRHQKVVEETPAPHLPDATRNALHEAARSAASAIDYRGAGTVEFLYDAAAGRFFFLEMNTRLQVEHPVTELVWDVDLVALQLAVAETGGFETSGRRAGSRPSPPEGRGHAVEARLYAEDPADDYRPQSGVLTRFDIPTPEGVRVDAGYATGSTVSTHYDAMLAKVIAHAPSRDAAIRLLADTLSRARIHGVATNRDFLVEVLRSPGFLAGDLSTAFLGGFETSGGRAEWSPPRPPSAAAVAACLALAAQAGAERTVQQGIPAGWRNVTSQWHRTTIDGVDVEWRGTRDGFVVAGYDVVSAAPDRVVLDEGGVRTTYDVAIVDGGVDVDSVHGHARLVRTPRFTDPADAVVSGSLLAPMPGTVVKVAVEKGDAVAAGDTVLVLEAMKMQHTVTAPYVGTITQIDVEIGAQVAAGQVLAVVEEQS